MPSCSAMRAHGDALGTLALEDPQGDSDDLGATGLSHAASRRACAGRSRPRGRLAMWAAQASPATSQAGPAPATTTIARKAAGTTG